MSDLRCSAEQEMKAVIRNLPVPPWVRIHKALRAGTSAGFNSAGTPGGKEEHVEPRLPTDLLLGPPND